MSTVPVELTAVELLQGVDRFWPAGHTYPPTAPWMMAYYRRAEAVGLARDLARRLAALLTRTRGTTAWGAVQSWLVQGGAAPQAAAVAFWRRTLHELLMLRQPEAYEFAGTWGPDADARRGDAVVERGLQRRLWWLPREAHFYPERWLFQAIQKVGPASWPRAASLAQTRRGPRSWDAPLGMAALAGAGSLLIQLMLPDNRGHKGAATCCCARREQRACAHSMATMSWKDDLGNVIQQASFRTLEGFERYSRRALTAALPPLVDKQLTEAVDQALQADPRTWQPRRQVGALFIPPLGSGSPCAEESAASAGQTSDALCCQWRLPTAPSLAGPLYVSTDGSLTGAGTRNDPVNLEYIQELLYDPAASYPWGLKILLQRGQTWTASDASDPMNNVQAGLVIRASGGPGFPILISSYEKDPDNPQGPPCFRGDGSITEEDGEVTVTRGTGYGIFIEGAEWVQVEDLQIKNFERGISVRSFRGTGGVISPVEPLRGARNIRLINMEIFENWNDGIQVTSNATDAVLALAYHLSRTKAAPWPELFTKEGGEPVLVIDDGKLYAVGVDDSLLEVFIDPAGWWPEKICIENNHIHTNGDGQNSSGVNVSLAAFSSLCRVRHNEINGGIHSEGWYNQCGRYATGQEEAPACVNVEVWGCDEGVTIEDDCTGASTSDCEPNETLWKTWGIDGIAMHSTGCGHIIENNYIHGHVFGQSAGSEKNCGSDDGNGIDIKSSGNRTYWFTNANNERELVDLPIVIRNNVIKNNMAPALLVHFGCRGLHVYNNEFSYNNGVEGSAIRIKAGANGNGWWESEWQGTTKEVKIDGTTYSVPVEGGPALMKDLFIYRNMIFRNGYLQGATVADDVAGGGNNAVAIREEGGELYHGSFDNVWIVNNTIANNVKYGLAVTINEEEPALVESEETGSIIGYDNIDTDYSFKGLHILNNIFSGNTGQNDDGVQLLNVDRLPPGRGFVCGLEMGNNCYYSPEGAGALVVWLIVEFSGLLGGIGLKVNAADLIGLAFTVSTGGVVPSSYCFGPSLGVGSIQEYPSFVDVGTNEYHLKVLPYIVRSPCIRSGRHEFGFAHFETGGAVTLGPDYDYDFLSVSGALLPSIGADEV